jgi:hypothetical protein
MGERFLQRLKYLDGGFSTPMIVVVRAEQFPVEALAAAIPIN